ncbi:hypothetical protein LXT21_38160 [Myxococcus sp. K38C18041901]|uniref:hypothetical protein n=1 Tax=Myxococcus guangdongensis TaxID=2906760 RepID=UPI0020A81A9F|nr:hypothetical protein [Myxococcus guangdongensis]MCP3064613.1 hypothetical protein [Myxococcus guangdongensis]
MLRTVIATTAVLGLAAGCAPDPSAPIKIRALVLSSNGQYIPEEVELKTVSDIVGLSGSVADLRGGARIVFDANDPDLNRATTPEAFANALLKGEGRDVTASYITQDDVLWPADFHTWNMVTTYYNLERSFDYFREVTNIPVADFKKPVATYYFPEFVITSVDNDPLKDNALYFSAMESFLVLPFDKLQRAPLAINAGVITHEYAHRVFNLKAYGGNPFPEALSVWSSAGGPSPGANILKSFDEGLADLHAYGATCRSKNGCNTRFLTTSFHGPDFGRIPEDRDLAKADRCIDQNLRDSLRGASLDQFSGNEYRVGTIFASALYQAGQSTGQMDILLRSIVTAYNDESLATPGLLQLTRQYLSNQTNFTLAVAAGAIITHVTDLRLKEAVCNELMDHLQIPRDLLVGTTNPNLCPPSAAGGTTCPRLSDD